MSREVRRVKADWEHPKDGFYPNGEIRYDALFDGSRYQDAVDRWDEEKAQWENKEYPDYADEEDKQLSFEEWDGPRPDAKDYMPAWTDEEKTHFMLYETTSEGTPKSPAFATVEELARWLTDTGATTFGSMTTTYDRWLEFCNANCGSVGFSISTRGVISGVDEVAIANVNARRVTSINADFDGDTPYYPAPVNTTEWSISRRDFNNLSLTAKNRIRKQRRKARKES